MLIIRSRYISERSRTILYHDSEIDRYDACTSACTRHQLYLYHDLVPAPGFLPHPPHTFFFGPRPG